MSAPKRQSARIANVLEQLEWNDSKDVGRCSDKGEGGRKGYEGLHLAKYK